MTDIVGAPKDAGGDIGVRLLRAKDVAEYLDLPSQTVWKYARQGVIGGVVRVGRQIRFDSEKLREWMSDGGQSFEGGWQREPKQWLAVKSGGRGRTDRLQERYILFPTAFVTACDSCRVSVQTSRPPT